MKPKYKLGQMLETSDSVFGKVTAVTMTESMVTYGLDDESSVEESKVVAVYREVKPRKPRTPKSQKRSKKSVVGTIPI